MILQLSNSSFTVVNHKEIDPLQLYVVVEQQLKLEFPQDTKPFDLKNRYQETPLQIAVIKRLHPVRLQNY